MKSAKVADVLDSVTLRVARPVDVRLWLLEIELLNG